METIFRNIWTGLTTASPLDQLNLVIGVVGVVLMIRRTLWAFPVGMLAVAVQGVLFYRAKFPADAALQVFFFVSLGWGWWHWVRARGPAPELPVTLLGWKGRALAVLAVGVATAAWALVVPRWLDTRMPWRDAAIAMFQVVGQVLQARKNLENWAFFTVANILAVYAYWSAELAYTAFLFALYLGLGLAGWRAWWKAMRA